MGKGPLNIKAGDVPKAAEVSGDGKFPMHVHKAEGEHKDVANEEELAAALKDGWYADVRDVPTADAPAKAKATKKAKKK